MTTKRKTVSFDESLAFAVAEDALRSNTLLKGRVPGALRLGQLLGEHGSDCPYRSASSAVAVCFNKRKTSKKIGALHSIKNYRCLSAIRDRGTVLLPDFSVDNIDRMERSFRRDLSEAGLCRENPGHFCIDFEFLTAPLRVNVHVHGIIHQSDVECVDRLRSMRWYKSRPDCRRPIVVSTRKPEQHTAGFLGYMGKSNWSVRTPHARFRPDGNPRREQQRLPSPHFETFLVEMDRVRPEQLFFRVGGGKGRH